MAPLLQLGLKFHNYGLFEVTQRQISFIELTPGFAHVTVCLKPITHFKSVFLAANLCHPKINN